jgi:hypothetical protein
MSVPIPTEAYGLAISLVGILVKQVEKWLSAKSGKTVEEVRADIKKELNDTDADLAADRDAERAKYNAP